MRNQRNYRITDADKIGSGSLKQKCRQNLAAIELLKRLEAEGRSATDDEKRVLVRYVGWGGLPQVFDAWNDEWKEERERLEQLLTPDELDSARATTLNAHYTAPVVTLAGFQIIIADNLMQGPEIVLKGATTYTAKVTDTAHGTMRSVEHTVQHLEDVAETLTRNIADTRKRLADTQAQVNTPFEYAERLGELVKRQQEIEDELDLTKNQASAQLGADTPKEMPTTEPDADSLKECYDGEWY